MRLQPSDPTFVGGHKVELQMMGGKNISSPVEVKSIWSNLPFQIRQVITIIVILGE